MNLAFLVPLVLALPGSSMHPRATPRFALLAAAQQGSTGSPQAPVSPPQTLPQLPAVEEDTFTNPVLSVGPDPWVVAYKGFYYYTHSTGSDLRLWKTRDLTDLRHAERRVVWTPPPDTEYSEQLWAPELHRLDAKWYFYFAADDGENRHHHIFVLENTSDDPEDGAWIFKGMLSDPSLRWAIDPTILEQDGKRYLVWSGWPDNKNVVQNLYIAELANPWTIKGKRKLISKPDLPWEKQIGHPDPSVEIPRKGVNEGPEILQHLGRHGASTFLVYSASGCWTDSYTLGLLTLSPGKDPMKRKSWTKTDHPLLSSDPAASAYGTGHNGFFLSPDGTQNWIIYHSNPEPDQGCGNHRSSRMQPFHFDPGTDAPIFGLPAPLDQVLAKPSGTGQGAASAPSE